MKVYLINIQPVGYIFFSNICETGHESIVLIKKKNQVWDMQYFNALNLTPKMGFKFESR